MNDFFSPSGFLGNGEQVGGCREYLLTGGLVSHPDGSQVYFASVLHLITGASVTAFSGGGKERRKMRDTSHEPRKKHFLLFVPFSRRTLAATRLNSTLLFFI